MREDWVECKFEDLLDYEQPTKYIVNSTKYNDNYKTPVLTAGKSFIKGYTNETDGLFENLPTIIFDDFTTASKYVSFKFKVKSSAMKILVPTSELVNMKFMYYCMQVNQIRSDTHKRYWISIYSQKNILVPPLPEQRAIVAKIEQLFSELDNGIANFKTAQKQLKVYRQAVLKDAFEGKFTQDWRKKSNSVDTAGEILLKIQRDREIHYQNHISKWKKAVSDWQSIGSIGKKPSRISKPKVLNGLTESEIELYGELPSTWKWSRFCNVTYKIGDIDHKMPKTFLNGIPYLSTGNLKKDGSIDFKSAKTISRADFDRLSLKIRPEKGDIIFSRYGTIGRNILIDFNKEFLVSYSCAIIKNITSIMDKKFILYYSLSPVIKKEIKRYTVDTTQANIGISSIENFVFPVCSREEQHQIVLEIESRLSVCDKVEETIKESLKKAEALRQSILKKAFKGELLSQQELEACKKEADWEPAEILLERIKGVEGRKDAPKNAAITRPKTIAKSISTTDMHAGVITKVIQLHESNPEYLDKLSHIKCEKIAHLAEYYVGLDLGRVPQKDAAGPDDYPHLKKVESRAQKAGFFIKVPQDIGYSYKTNGQANAIIQKTDAFLDNEQAKKLEYLLQTFLKFDLEQAEIVATTYAGWNNLLLDGIKPTEEQIVYESRENWSKRKLTIPRERFFKAIQWMKNKDLAPNGNGLKVEKPITKKRSEKA